MAIFCLMTKTCLSPTRMSPLNSRETTPEPVGWPLRRVDGLYRPGLRLDRQGAPPRTDSPTQARVSAAAPRGDPPPHAVVVALTASQFRVPRRINVFGPRKNFVDRTICWSTVRLARERRMPWTGADWAPR
jgi:hypothetical protein